MATAGRSRLEDFIPEIGEAKKIYMIGVKGVGMTMLAQYLAKTGAEISGSDRTEKFKTDGILKKLGVKIKRGFDKKNIPSDIDLIIYSTAYSAETNEEVAAALNNKNKRRTLSLPLALAAVFNGKFGIAVTGTHGKTTTAAWLGYIMWKAGLKPSVMVGSPVPQFNGAGLAGESDYLVIEADEYQNKLQYYLPLGAIVTNIDYDHPDFFPNKKKYRDIFAEFIKKIPKKGFLVANFDDPIIRKIIRTDCRARVVTYAINEAADYAAGDIKQIGDLQYFKVKLGREKSINDGPAGQEPEDGGNLGDFCIQLAGRHNVSNALAVIAAGVELGVALNDIRQYLEEFRGADRRMQVMGKFRGATVISDYAHHPTEIRATLAAVRRLYKYRKIMAVFQPHTFTRTKVLLDDFARSFGEADEIIILDIYGSAREKSGGVSSRDLVKRIKAVERDNATDRNILDAIPFMTGTDLAATVRHISTLKKCEEYLRENIERDDVVVLMGAGDIYRLGERIAEK